MIESLWGGGGGGGGGVGGGGGGRSANIDVGQSRTLTEEVLINNHSLSLFLKILQSAKHLSLAWGKELQVSCCDLNRPTQLGTLHIHLHCVQKRSANILGLVIWWSAQCVVAGTTAFVVV